MAITSIAFALIVSNGMLLQSRHPLVRHSSNGKKHEPQDVKTLYGSHLKTGHCGGHFREVKERTADSSPVFSN